MQLYVLTVIYYIGPPTAYEVEAKDRSDALRQMWARHSEIAEFVKKIEVVLR